MKINLKPYILLLLVIIIYIIISTALGITCPVKYFTGKICPTCGTTRALLALIKLNIDEYINYNFMALPMTIAILLYIGKENFKNKYIIDVIVFCVIILNLIIYIIRLNN